VWGKQNLCNLRDLKTVVKDVILREGNMIANMSEKDTLTFYPDFDVLLTVHLSIFISIFNQLDAQKFVSQ